MRAVLTTFSAILKLDIDLPRRTVAVEKLDDGKGIYFGLTGHRRGLLVVARNQDSDFNLSTPGVKTQVIYRLDPATGSLEPVIDDPILADLHQIRVWGNKLFVVLGVGTAIAVFDLKTGKREAVIDLKPFVPEDLLSDPPHLECDPFHFNSLTFTATQAFVLAHNWGQPSFALQFALPGFGTSRPMRLAAIHRNLGLAAHDIFYCDQRLYVLDSLGGRLLVRHNDADTWLDLTNGGEHEPFPRGLAVTRDHMIIGYGDWESERERRKNGKTRIMVINRHSMAIELIAELGDYGNSSDILCISERDVTDGQPSWWRARPRFMAQP
jgi:hypothetical protein